LKCIHVFPTNLLLAENASAHSRNGWVN